MLFKVPSTAMHRFVLEYIYTLLYSRLSTAGEPAIRQLATIQGQVDGAITFLYSRKSAFRVFQDFELPYAFSFNTSTE